MAISDDIHDEVITHAINLDRVRVAHRNKVIAFLLDLQADLVKEITRFDPTGSKSLTIQQNRLKRLLKQTNSTIAKYYRGIASENNSMLRSIAKIEVAFGIEAMNVGIGADVLSLQLIPEQLDVLVSSAMIEGAPIRQWWVGQSNGLKRRFLQAMRLGVARGESVPDLIRRVRGTRENSFTDGVMQISRREAETLVRSSVQIVSNESRNLVYEKNADLMKGIQWVATLDTRTSDICRALDGKMWTPPPRKPIGHKFAFPGPIAHWGCRSTQIPVLKSWQTLAKQPVVQTGGRKAEFQKIFERKLKERGLTQDQIKQAVAGARASMNGQVAQSTTFNDWLKAKEKQEKGFIADLLGERKAKLFKAGKITTTDLIDQNLNPVSIEELERLASRRRKRR